MSTLLQLGVNIIKLIFTFVTLSLKKNKGSMPKPFVKISKHFHAVIKIIVTLLLSKPFCK